MPSSIRSNCIAILFSLRDAAKICRTLLRHETFIHSQWHMKIFLIWKYTNYTDSTNAGVTRDHDSKLVAHD